MNIKSMKQQRRRQIILTLRFWRTNPPETNMILFGPVQYNTSTSNEAALYENTSSSERKSLVVLEGIVAQFRRKKSLARRVLIALKFTPIGEGQSRAVHLNMKRV